MHVTCSPRPSRLQFLHAAKIGSGNAWERGTLGEEAYLAYSILSHQNVSGRQVSVYEGLLREVAHPGCNLATVTQQGLGCGLLPRTREEGKKGRSFGEREQNETCLTSENILSCIF